MSLEPGSRLGLCEISARLGEGSRMPAAMKWSRFGALALAASLVGAASGPAPQTASDRQQARVLAHSVLPAASFRGGSPPSGAFLTPAERAVAAANGVDGPGAGPFFSAQPIQGFSSLVPGADGAWWALADNGYAWRDNSA
ncbi:MAG: glycerophosphoryl diester phosphodiesterase, partial [Acidobacteriota bacterium]|nr:glycerophosphoryl diester phosphodiesterase [Acidobacteriota bacterium]